MSTRLFGWLAPVLSVGLVAAALMLITTTAAGFTGSAGASHTVATTTLVAPTGLAAVRNPSIQLSWTNASPRMTGTSIYRSITGGSWTRVAQVAAPGTSYTDAPGAGTFRYYAEAYYSANGANWTSPASAAVVRDDPTFVLAGSTAFTTSNCATGTVGSRDMIQGYAPPGPESTFTGQASTGTVVFCSDRFTAGQTIAGGTTSVALYWSNASGAGCAVVATLALNGTTLGSGGVTLNPTVTALRSWSFTTSAATMATGDRLNLTIEIGTSKACNSTTLHYNAPATPSSVTVPDLP